MASPGEIRQVSCLLRGELMAEAAARALAEAMPHPGLRRAYARQADDEVRHAALLRGYLSGLGAEAETDPEVPELDGYRRFLRGHAEQGRLLHLVLGVNVGLEGLACVGLALSARWVESTGEDPAWVALMNAIERDERRHTRLAEPALLALGGGSLPAETREVMGEVRRASVDALDAAGCQLSRWGVNPAALFDHAVREAHPGLAGALA